MSRILVIASNSFTGSHFINHSLKEGHNIVGISRSNEYSTVMLPYLYEGSNNQSFRFNKLDVNNDLENILKIFGYKFDGYYLIDSEDRHKGNRIKKILEKYPQCTTIKYWEDKDKWINAVTETLKEYPNIKLEVTKTI